ncbi:hypothetical protein Avbf_10533 [Armadillidium vulgare]|nr:hypothetical protein Avbf_10533 [Armadillidium vulgare]
MISSLNAQKYILEPQTHIYGGPDVFINKGSNINLTCIVEYTPDPPSFVTWKRNGRKHDLR